MKTKQFTTLVIGAGIVLFALSYLIPVLVGGRRAWSEEDARAYSQVGAQLHNAMHGHAHEEGHAGEEGSHSEGLEELQARFAVHKGKLEAAQNRGRLTSRILFGLGVVCLGVGVVVYYVTRE